MAIFVEIAIVILLISIVVFCARPMFEAYSEKLRTKYKEVDSEKADQLEKRIRQLEGEVIDLRQQLKSVQDSAEFALGMLREKESQESNPESQTNSETIDLKMKTKN